jgi:hypothetical protein
MHIILLTLALLAPLAVKAQSLASPLKKVAIISLIGDQLSVDVYRRRAGSNLDINDREVVPLNDPVFDHTALFAVADAGAKLIPTAAFLPLAVPKAGSLLDPNFLLLDKSQPIAGSIADTLQKQGFDHLLVVTKHSASAQLRFADGNGGSGQLKGLGFYVDNTVRTRQGTTGAWVPGFIAPYAYLKLTLIDLGRGSIIKEETATASKVRSAAENKDATGAWDALSPTDKADMLRELIEKGISTALPKLLQGK